MRARYKNGIIGLAVFFSLGTAACGNSDSTSSAGAESAGNEPTEAAVASEEIEYVLPENSGLLFEDDTVAPIAFDAPVVTIPEVEVTTTFVENYTTTSEATTTTAVSEPTFNINVAPEPDASSSETSTPVSSDPNEDSAINIGQEVTNEEPLRRLHKPADCLLTKLRVDDLVQPLDDPANDEVYKRFVYDAFWACLYRPVDIVPDDDGWLIRLKEAAGQESATVAQLEAVAADMVLKGIHPSREASCMRGGFECSPELDLKNAEGMSIPIECAFAKGQPGYEKIQVSHEKAKLRIQSLCPDAELDIEVVAPATPVSVEKAPAPAPVAKSPTPAAKLPSSPVAKMGSGDDKTAAKLPSNPAAQLGGSKAKCGETLPGGGAVPCVTKASPTLKPLKSCSGLACAGMK